MKANGVAAYLFYDNAPEAVADKDDRHALWPLLTLSFLGFAVLT
jgi:hypothetical protein